MVKLLLAVSQPIQEKLVFEDFSVLASYAFLYCSINWALLKHKYIWQDHQSWLKMFRATHTNMHHEQHRISKSGEI